MRLPPPKPLSPRQAALPKGMMYGPDDTLIPIPPKKGGVRPVSPVKPGVRPKKPIKPVMPGRPTNPGPGVTGVMPKPTPEDMKALAESREKLKGAVSRPKGMAYGGMAKKGYVKGGVVKANCGASMKPAQGKGK